MANREFSKIERVMKDFSLGVGEEGGSGTSVVANPTLVGDEPNLEGLQVGEQKYKVGGSGGSGKIYQNLISFEFNKEGYGPDGFSYVLSSTQNINKEYTNITKELLDEIVNNMFTNNGVTLNGHLCATLVKFDENNDVYETFVFNHVHKVMGNINVESETYRIDLTNNSYTREIMGDTTETKTYDSLVINIASAEVKFNENF